MHTVHTRVHTSNHTTTISQCSYAYTSVWLRSCALLFWTQNENFCAVLAGMANNNKSNLLDRWRLCSNVARRTIYSLWNCPFCCIFCYECCEESAVRPLKCFNVFFFVSFFSFARPFHTNKSKKRINKRILYALGTREHTFTLRIYANQIER